MWKSTLYCSTFDAAYSTHCRQRSNPWGAGKDKIYFFFFP
jgi:hypothetical protein